MTAPAASWLETGGFAVRRQFVSPWGICDLVGLQFNHKNVAHRLKYGQTRRITSVTRAALLLAVPDRDSGESITMEHLTRIHGDIAPAEILVQEVQKLENDGFVVRSPRGHLQRLNGWVPLQRNLVAIELKLHRIDEAMLQAWNNLGFADRSYVGLPADVARRVAAGRSRWSRFFEDGIGLLSVDTGGCRVLVAPRSKQNHRRDKALQLYCVDKFWHTQIRGN